MITTIPTKDIGKVRNAYRPNIEYKSQLENKIEKWIKSNLRLDDE